MAFFAAPSSKRSVTDVPWQARRLLFQELVLLTQLPVLRPQIRYLGRLRGFLAVLIGSMLFPVPGDPTTYRLGDKVI